MPPLRSKHHKIIFIFSAIISSYPAIARAQIVPDRTLPSNSRVTVNGSTIEIDGGTTKGTNLFHSFRAFSLNPDNLTNNIDTAHFNNGIDITHIFSRVTGNSPSEINGLIETNGSADLFLIAPNGIVFGENAALDIGGSFIGSTASSIRFADGEEFSAVNPQSNALLSINIPSGLQYGMESGTIEVFGKENRWSFDTSDRTMDRQNIGFGLEVSQENTLALIGGNIALKGGQTTALEGNVELGSVGKGDTVELYPDDAGWEVDYSLARDLGAVSLDRAASVVGKRVRLTGDAVSLKDNSVISDRGLSGSLLIESNSLLLDGSQVRLAVDSELDAGNLEIKATEIVLKDSGLFSVVEKEAEGNGANINLFANKLTLDERSQITLSTLGLGNGGDLNIDAVKIELTNSSALRAMATVDIGNSGDIAIATDNLLLQDGARIYAGNFIDTVAPESNTLHTLQAIPQSLNYTIIGSGEAGNIDIRAELIVLDSAIGKSSQISTGTFAGGGGIIKLNADNIALFNNSQISTETKGDSHGGGIYLTAENLYLSNGGKIGTETFARGNGGKVFLETTKSLILWGDDSEIYSRASFDADGSVGKIGITGNVIHLGKKDSRSGNIRDTGGNFSSSNENNLVNMSLDRGVNIYSNEDSLMNSSCLWQQNYATAQNRRVASQNLDRIYRHQADVESSLVEAQSWIVNSAGNVELLARSCK